MIHYELHKNLADYKNGLCTKLVLRDSVSDEIVFFAVCLTDDTYIMGKKGDDNFDKYVKVFNLDNADNRNGIEPHTTDD